MMSTIECPIRAAKLVDGRASAASHSLIARAAIEGMSWACTVFVQQAKPRGRTSWLLGFPPQVTEPAKFSRRLCLSRIGLRVYRSANAVWSSNYDGKTPYDQAVERHSSAAVEHLPA